MSKPCIRVLCVDDHRIVREGIALIIDRQPDMEVVGVAAKGEQAVTLFSSLRPDVTLMDLQLGRMSGLAAISAIRTEHPEARIVVLTTYDGDEDIYRALEAGAATYLLKDALSDDLIDVVRQVPAGKRPIGPHVQARLRPSGAAPPQTAEKREAGAGFTARGCVVLCVVLPRLRRGEVCPGRSFCLPGRSLRDTNLLIR